MQQQMLQCPKCGRQNAIGQQFCGACGEKLQHVSSISGTRVDASQAQMAARRYLESAYTKHLRDVHFTKCWYSHAGSQSFWDVEGFMLTKKAVRGSKELHFRFQIDPNSGEVLGYEI
jgi:hypothetical protein